MQKPFYMNMLLTNTRNLDIKILCVVQITVQIELDCFVLALCLSFK